jgi:lipid-binding SYLF domain-containing protein
MNRIAKELSRVFVISLFALSIFSATNSSAYAKSAAEIDASVNEALSKFHREVPAADQLMKDAKGVLVFPSVIKAGFGIGGEYGTGALRIGGKTVDYYRLISGTLGFQFGGQARTVIMVFLEQSALDHFRRTEGWKAGVDGSVAVITLDAGAGADTIEANEPILAFILDRKGLMYNLTLEGSKISKIHPKY